MGGIAEKGYFVDLYGQNDDRLVITNIAELVACSDTDGALCFCESDEKYRRRETSDFEYFFELLRILPELKGTLVYENICGILREFCDISEMDEALSENDIRNIWMRGNDKLFKLCGGEYNALLEKYSAKKLHLDRFAFLDDVCVGKCYKGKADTTFVYDIRSLDFIRPDPYHYGCVVEKKNNGEKLNDQEISILLSQTLYLELSKKQRGKIQLHLRIDPNKKTAYELINYLKGRHFLLDVYIAFEGEQRVEDIASLCLLSDEFVRVRPEIVLTRTDTFANLCARMKLLFAVYPYKKVSYGGSVTDSPAFFLGRSFYAKALERVVEENEM